MFGPWLLLALVLIVTAFGAAEFVLHRRALFKIPIRIHVNGTRGKSSVTRLVAAGLRAAGVRTCAKTTGTLARMILPDGSELPIYRPAGANIIEQKRIVAAAAEFGAQALVIECMALQPELQAVCESKLISATHAVITNARPDHLDVMGPGAREVALALAGTTPRGGKLFTAEREHLAVLKMASADRKSELVSIGPDEIAAVTSEELARFSYREHADNVALALRVCRELGVERGVALDGMQRAAPDPGALTVHEVNFFGRKLTFFNAFAANDPVSTEQLWQLALDSTPGAGARIAIVNCRDDRPERSQQLGEQIGKWPPPDQVVLMGSGTYLFARAASKSGYDAARLQFVEGLTVEEIFERIVSLSGRSALLFGMGNIGGQGIELARYFRNRAEPALEAAS
ncbi:MAG TPA: poly-gamma-glutamate synthase PgsB [Polyangiaceae bacterium]|nr:poly-gamma-glutamate synthase PgsB [Polyangiaceae bacterium]